MKKLLLASLLLASSTALAETIFDGQLYNTDPQPGVTTPERVYLYCESCAMKTEEINNEKGNFSRAYFNY